MFRAKRSPDTIMVGGEKIFAREAFRFMFTDTSPYSSPYRAKDEFGQPYLAPSNGGPTITFYDTEESYRIFLDLGKSDQRSKSDFYWILHISYKNCSDQGQFFADSRKVHEEHTRLLYEEHTRLLYMAWNDSVRNPYV